MENSKKGKGMTSECEFIADIMKLIESDSNQPCINTLRLSRLLGIIKRKEEECEGYQVKLKEHLDHIKWLEARYVEFMKEAIKAGWRLKE